MSVEPAIAADIFTDVYEDAAETFTTGAGLYTDLNKQDFPDGKPSTVAQEVLHGFLSPLRNTRHVQRFEVNPNTAATDLKQAYSDYNLGFISTHPQRVLEGLASRAGFVVKHLVGHGLVGSPQSLEKMRVVAQCRMVWYPSRRHFNGKD